MLGNDWWGEPAWNTDTYAHFDATVRITAGSVEGATKCLERQYGTTIPQRYGAEPASVTHE